MAEPGDGRSGDPAAVETADQSDHRAVTGERLLPFDRRGYTLRRDSGHPGIGRHERGQVYDLLAEAQLRGQITSARSATDLAGFLVTSLQGLRVMGAINPDRAALTRYAEVALTCLD
ncbi:hypothetical protein ABZ356_20725 [Micromonospora zamorensis]|uniref:hypothetical protein n=1 Tax=Micromonospora zamorensis TaxID=709883 RepID=UPI0033BC3DF0